MTEIITIIVPAWVAWLLFVAAAISLTAATLELYATILRRRLEKQIAALAREEE